ncbi:unnamed protein product [Orchesella dallaii]|uniref:CHHC U11-48K-type domain-containing protein n=1 Tax=Orchesella dallaii TaxID=48710 RepID=A0ABP1S6T4_9HEXA
MAAFSGKLQVESKDSRINYNLLPGEKLMTCPYNHSHAILPIKFNKHVLHCHRLHCKEQAKLGKPPLFAICQYDRAHHVPKELLEYHESTCETKVRAAAGDDWGWDEEFGDGVVVPSYSGGNAGGIKTEKVIPEVTLEEPPPIDEASLKRMQSEDWEDGPVYEKRFDPEKRISQLRSNGYSLVKYPKPNLTKSEKKEFYAEEAEVKAAHKAEFKRYEFLMRIKEQNAAAGVRKQEPSGATKDALMLPIREEP